MTVNGEHSCCKSNVKIVTVAALHRNVNYQVVLGRLCVCLYSQQHVKASLLRMPSSGKLHLTRVTLTLCTNVSVEVVRMNVLLFAVISRW